MARDVKQCLPEGSRTRERTKMLSFGMTPDALSPSELAYVPPGRLLATDAPKPLTTIVSTGAVVCIWDPVSGVGGMAHFLLPESGSAPPAPRFGDIALRTLIDDLVKLGAPERRLRAKVYGGSAPPLVTQGGHLGDHNIEKALAFLKSRFVPVIENDSGGARARKIVFDPKAGTSAVSRIGLN
jgi:chemotaxis protein CheD